MVIPSEPQVAISIVFDTYLNALHGNLATRCTYSNYFHKYSKNVVFTYVHKIIYSSTYLNPTYYLLPFLKMSIYI